MVNFEDINPDLCHFCGNCAAICPTNCLSLGNHGEKISFRKEKCINCGLCHRTCPGVEFSFPKSRGFFKKFCRDDVKFDDFIGQYDSFFVGQTTDKEILKNSSSGGLAPSILIYALEKKIIDAAVLVVENKNSPLGYKIAIAKTKKEVLERCQSMYCTIPLNIILKEIKKLPSCKLGYAGLPCHVEGIRKLQMNNDESAKKIKLLVGLFCGLNKSFKATEFFLSKTKIKKEDVLKFSHREGEWPGNLYIKTRDGTEKRINKDIYGFSYYMFALKRCLVCYDFTNEFADISLGDGWSKLPSKQGWNDIIVRSALGKEIIKRMKQDNLLNMEEKSLGEILNSHKGYFSFKKRGVFCRINSLKLKPDYGEERKCLLSDKLTFLFVKLLRLKLVKKIFFVLPLSLTGGAIILLRKILKKIKIT